MRERGGTFAAAAEAAAAGGAAADDMLLFVRSIALLWVVSPMFYDIMIECRQDGTTKASDHFLDFLKLSVFWRALLLGIPHLWNLTYRPE